MDVDELAEHRLAPILSYFETASDSFPWRGTRPQEIERRRAQLNDVFIFDLILSGGGIRNSDTLFPPHDVPSLERLLAAIESSNYDTLKKECLVYWLLKWHMDGRELRFSEDRCIPPQFVVLSDAYWCLDAGVDIPRAISILSDSRLNRDFVSKILHSISTAPDASSLILKYVRTAKPILTEPDDIDLYANALADSSFLHAWQYQRTFGEGDMTKERLIRNFVGWCLTPKPKPHALAQLLNFPVNPFEEALLTSIASPSTSTGREQSYLSQIPRLSRLAQVILQDLICTRLVQGGRYTEAIKADREFSSNVPTSQPSIRDDDVALVQARVQERNRTMREVYASLPFAERMLLDMDLEAPPTKENSAARPGNKPIAANGLSGEDLTMSWEEVRLPPPVVPKSNAPPNKPAPRKSHGGLFGSSSSSPYQASSSTQAPLLASTIISSASKPGAGLNDSAVLRSSTSGRVSFPPVPVTTASPYSSATRPRLSFPTGIPRLSSGGGAQRPTSLFSAPQTSKVPTQFTPATSMRNAFYNPPPVKSKDDTFATRGYDGIASGPDAQIEDDSRSIGQQSDLAEEQVRDYDMADDQSIADRSESEAGELSYSVFSTRHAAGDEKQKKRSRKLSGHSVTPAPPGHFVTTSGLSDRDGEDEGTDDGEDLGPWSDHLGQLRAEGHHQHLGLPKGSKSTRGSIVGDSVSASVRTRSKVPITRGQEKPVKPPRQAKKREVKPTDLTRSIPGGLMDDDDDDAPALQEEVDELAPLPSQSSKISSRKPRRSRASLSVSDAGDDDDGPQTRRRSSRLSAVHTPAADEGGAKSTSGRTSTRRKR